MTGNSDWQSRVWAQGVSTGLRKKVGVVPDALKSDCGHRKVPKGVCEPPEVEGEDSDKSRLAEQENHRMGWAGWNLKALPVPAMGQHD